MKNNVVLKVVKDEDFGIEVIQEDDAYFSLCLFLSDIKYDAEFKELFNEIEKSEKNSNYFNTSYNTSRIEISSLGAVIADQEDESCWFFELPLLKRLLQSWETVLIKNSFPTSISFSSRLLSDLEYSKLTSKMFKERKK